MDEIKFRGRSVHTGKMIIGSYAIIDNENYIIDFNCHLERIVPFTISQYIGIKDMNGKEIYEGDIIEDKNYDLYVVSYDKENAQFFCFDLKIKTNISFLFFINNYISVIGNIYDNPELIKN